MAVVVYQPDGRKLIHGEPNGKDNVALQFIDLAGGRECALLIKETFVDQHTGANTVQDTIYPVRNILRLAVQRIEKPVDG